MWALSGSSLLGGTWHSGLGETRGSPSSPGSPSWPINHPPTQQVHQPPTLGSHRPAGLRSEAAGLVPSGWVSGILGGVQGAKGGWPFCEPGCLGHATPSLRLLGIMGTLASHVPAGPTEARRNSLEPSWGHLELTVGPPQMHLLHQPTSWPGLACGPPWGFVAPGGPGTEEGQPKPGWRNHMRELGPHHGLRHWGPYSESPVPPDLEL